MKLLTPAVAAVLLAAMLPASAENWADSRDPVTTGPEYAQSKAICRGLKGTLLPRSEGLGTAAAAPLKGCRSEVL